MRNLNFRHLHYFWAVAKEGHLTRVAEQLHLSQSALSAQIRALESYLGQPLFDRIDRRLKLTQFGATVLDYADSIFTLGQELMATVRAGDGRTLQELRIGAVATLSRNFLENLLRPLLADKDLRLSVVSGSIEELLERLRVHQLDVVFANRPAVIDARHPWRCQRIARQTVCVVGPPRSKGEAFQIPKDLSGQALVVPGPSSDIRSHFDLWCEKCGVNVNIYAEVDDMALLRLLARDSGALAVVPEVVVQDEMRSGQLLKYGTVPHVFESFYAITAQRRSPPNVLRRLLGCKRAKG
ncbi:MAG: LysR family transcriptional regulator [Proteobacteria bacterium]|nr:LysR family transcriptional regulator [Pseudomonadota bacterium]